MRTKYLVRSLFLLLLAAVTGGCSSMNSQENCEKSIKNYNRMLRWGELESASVSLVDKEKQPEFDRGVEQFRRNRVNIVDFRIRSQQCQTDRKQASSTVEFDYFLQPDYRIRTVTDHQKWQFREGEKKDAEGVNGWRLISPFPDFR